MPHAGKDQRSPRELGKSKLRSAGNVRKLLTRMTMRLVGAMELAEPARHLVPTGENLCHQPQQQSARLRARAPHLKPSIYPSRLPRSDPRRQRHFLTAGFQFCSNVIGAGALSRTVLIRKRPSRATSYWRPCCQPRLPPCLPGQAGQTSSRRSLAARPIRPSGRPPIGRPARTRHTLGS